MRQTTFRLGKLVEVFRYLTVALCVVSLAPGEAASFAMQAAPPPQQGAEQTATIPNEELDSLVAPIALYPDPLLSQTLVASTYPLELVQLQQWLDKNKNLKGDALTQAVMKQAWDPSIQAMAQFPDLVKLLTDNIKWTDDLGNAFLAQQSGVMEAVQRMRMKAQNKGTLKSSKELKVQTKVIEKEPVIIIEQSSPDVVYVPSYDPVVVYGASYYPYPPVAYPAGYYAAGAALSFGMGLAMGAAWGHGGWGWNCGWGGGNNNININRNNNYVNHYNRQNNISSRPGGGQDKWQHNPQHRGGAPYGDRATANRFGGTSRGDSLSNRQATARQSQRPGQRTASDRGGFGGRDQGGIGGDRGGSLGRGDRGAGGGGDRVGNRQAGNTPRGGGDGAFGGRGSSGSSARASSSRGQSSWGGGGRRGGGGGGRRR